MPNNSEIEGLIRSADVIIISGGNSLWAVDRWKQLKIDVYLREACKRGAVLCGGSFGAVCWFDGGHSDSGDPATFRQSMLALENPEEAQSFDGNGSSCWEYIRCNGLGFLPGFCCPHFDMVQSNGVLRSASALKMMTELTHNERAIGIDHWAGLAIENGSFEVFSLEGRNGSVKNGKYCADRTLGNPGAWIVDTVDGNPQFSAIPKCGRLRDILKEPVRIVEDERCNLIRQQNPSVK